MVHVRELIRHKNPSYIPSDWKYAALGEIGNLLSGLTYSPDNIDENGTLVLRSSNINNGFLEFDDNVYVDTTSLKFNPVEEGDILICVRNGSKSLIGKNALITEEAEGMAFGAFMALYRSEHNQFLTHLFNTDLYNSQIHRNLGATINSINGSDFKKFHFPFPPRKERIKIAEILSTWDEAISTQGQLLKESLRRKKGLEQQLLSGKVRFGEFVNSTSSHKTPVGELPEDWELKLISDIVERVKKPFTPEPDTLYREIGIRSHCKGIFHKEEVTGVSLGNKSVFWIQPDCFVVNIVFAWEHAIAKTTEAEVGMIASHRFPMYKPKKGVLDLDYLLYYFKTARGKHLLGLASPGGAGRNKTLGQSEFAKLKIPVPSIEEQKKIVAVLAEADKEIELLQKHIDTLKEQKKGLMQKLLTGEIRVKIN